MPSTFMGLQTAVRGLMAQQLAIDTTSHNIDNANTPGYSRQRVDLVESPALNLPGVGVNPGQLGTGVQSEDITRLRDRFLDSQYQNQNQYLGQAQVQQDTLNKITGIINEPSNTGISTSLQNFWNAWDKLGSNPGSLSARTEVQQTGVTLAQTLNQTSNQLTSLSTDIRNNLSARVTQVNSNLGQIANLNQEIQNVQATGQTPNDLMDQRDELVDQVSQLANVTVSQTAATPTKPAIYQLSIGGQVVVANNQVGTLSVSSSSPVGIQVTHFDSTTQAFDTTAPLDNILSPGGELQGTLNSLGYVASYQGNLDNIAQALAGTSTQGQMNVKLQGTWSLVGITGGGTPTFPVSGTFADGTTFAKGDPITKPAYASEGITASTNSDGTVVATIPSGATVTVNGLNGLQQIGFSQSGLGQAFFVSSVVGQPINAANISVGVTAPQIAAGTRVQPGTTVAMPGDGTLAIAMSGVKDIQTSFPNPTNSTLTMTGTVNNFLQAVVGQLGIQGQQANNQVTNQQSLVQQLDKQRQSVSGVSLDEEMASMIKYQQAYSASAKMISTISQMLDTLMNAVH